jgi:hypothetical protein
MLTTVIDNKRRELGEPRMPIALAISKSKMNTIANIAKRPDMSCSSDRRLGAVFRMALGRELPHLHDINSKIIR